MNHIYFDNHPLMIVQTSDGALYSVRDAGDPALAHVWIGVPVKATTKHGYVLKAKAREQLVRKAASRVIFAPAADPFARIA